MITITVGLGLLCGRGQGGRRRGQVLCEECSKGIKRVNQGVKTRSLYKQWHFGGEYLLHSSLQEPPGSTEGRGKLNSI